MKTSTGLLIILAIALRERASIPSTVELVRWQRSTTSIDTGAWKVVPWELPDWALNGPAPGRPLLSPLWMLEGGMWSRR